MDEKQTVYVVIGWNGLVSGLVAWTFSTRAKAEKFRASEACQSISDDTAIWELVVDEKAS